MLYKVFMPFCLLIFFSCQSGANRTSNAVAKDICGCFKPLVDMNEQVQTLLKNGKGTEAEALLPEVSELEKEGQECAGNLVKKYDAETTLNTTEISDAMREDCPKILNIVGQALFAE